MGVARTAPYQLPNKIKFLAPWGLTDRMMSIRTVTVQPLATKYNSVYGSSLYSRNTLSAILLYTEQEKH